MTYNSSSFDSDSFSSDSFEFDEEIAEVARVAARFDVCARCGFKCKARDFMKEWTGLYVCSECFETRHPQDFVRPRPERPAAWSQPEPDDIELSVSYIDSSVGVQT